jgi:N-acetylglutamate synthase-like GNAT family acetyltransferase
VVGVQGSSGSSTPCTNVPTLTVTAIIDTMVSARALHRGVGTRLIAMVVTEAHAAGCEWLHVDFEDYLRRFYFDACGFEPTNAGLIALPRA